MNSKPLSETCGYENRAQFYDIEYPEIRDHGFLISMVETSNSTTMVLPGGTGTTALALAKACPDCMIYSIDSEPAMVAVAHDRFETSGHTNLISVWGNMIDLSFEWSFDRIFVAREAFQMLPDDSSALACLRSLKRHLSKGGKIVLDVANFDVPDTLSDLNYYDARRSECVRYLDCDQIVGDVHFLRHVTQFANADGNRRFHFDYEIKTDGGQPSVKYDAKLALRKYDFRQLASLINQAGLSISVVYGDYDGSPFTIDSPRMCCLLE